MVYQSSVQDIQKTSEDEVNDYALTLLRFGFHWKRLRDEHIMVLFVAIWSWKPHFLQSDFAQPLPEFL